MPVLPLIKGDKQTKLDYRDNLPINFTAVAEPVKGDDGYLLAHDGLTEFAQTNGIARGGYYNERFAQHFRISGNSFESIATDGTVTQIGFIPGQTTCSFASSFNTQAVLSDGRMWLYDNAVLTEILDPELGVPIDITWFRGIYVLTDGESLFQTDINNEYSISPLKFSSSEFAADPIKGVERNDENQILAFNRYSIEYFFFNDNVPSGTSVLTPIQGKTAKIGIVGTHCKTEMEGAFFILGSRKEESVSVHVFAGGRSQKVATREIEKVIGKYTESELSSVVMETRVVDRDKFIIIHLPCETLIYNHEVASKYTVEAAWTYVKSGTGEALPLGQNVNLTPWRGKFGVFDPRNARWIYGDTQENKLGYLDTEIGSQYGVEQEYIFYTPIVEAEINSIDVFEIDTIPGFSSADISIGFSMSYDGGVSYGKEWFSIISTPQNYITRYISRRLGYIRDDFNFKFRYISKDKMAFSNLKVNELD